MTRTFVILALSASLAVLAVPSDVFAGRGGGRGGGGGYGGGGGGRGGYGGGGGGGGEMGHSPSFSQPRSSANEYHPQGSGEYGNRSQTGNRSPSGSQPEPGTRPATGNTANAGNRNSNANYPNAGAAAAGAGAANRNQTPAHPNAGAAAVGAGAANRNQTPEHPNAGAAAAGAGAANRNQTPDHPNAGAAAAGAGAANNRNQGSAYPNAGAAAAGAGVANNRNQGSAYPNAGAAVAGAGVANNRNQYDQYHPGMGAGYWNGNYANAWGMGGGGYGGVGAWGTGSSMYGWGYSGYSNPYSGGSGGGGGGGQQVDPNQPAPAYDYSQPISTTAAAPAPTAADQATALFDKGRDAFKSGDYPTALQLDQQALGQMPNDPTIHEFQALALFAQGRYEQAAAPLHAVLAVGPGWNWTTLIGNYPDANTYTEQIRGLETYVKANPKSAQARFVLAYHYIAQGHDEAAVKQLKGVVALQPNDTLSAQLVAQLQPAGAASPSPAAAPAPDSTTTLDQLSGAWVAPAPRNAKITLTMKDDGGFTWAVAGPGKPPMSIAGTATLANGVLSLAGKDTQAGALAGQVVRQDDSHFSFRALGGPADDPGLKFAR